MRRVLAIVGSIAALTMLSACWTVPGADSDRSGHNPTEHTISPANVATMTKAWTFDAGEDVPTQSPVRSRGGIHVVASCRLVTLDPATGAERWHINLFGPDGRCGDFPTEVVTRTPPYLLGDYVVAGVDDVYEDHWGASFYYRWIGSTSVASVDEDGSPNDPPRIEGVINSTRTRVVASTTAEDRNVDPPVQPVRTGHVWAAPVGEALRVAGGLDSSTMGAHVLVKTGDGQPKVEAYGLPSYISRSCGPDGTSDCPIWTFTADGNLVGHAVLANAGDTAFVGTEAGNVYALDGETGAVEWTANIGSPVAATAALADGMLYVPTGDGSLVVLDAATGAVRWRASTGSAIDVQPTVAGGVVFTGSHDGGVHAYAASGCGASTCPALWSTSVGAAVSDQPMVDSGLLHVPTADGRLVTYRPATS